MVGGKEREKGGGRMGKRERTGAEREEREGLRNRMRCQ